MATDEKNVPTNPSEISRPSFPTNPEDFDADDRISFSKLDNKFILEADDGQEFEFDDALKRWVPAVCPLKLSHHHHHHPWTVLMQPLLADGESNDLDNALLEQQRQAYAVQGVDESEPAQPQKKKRKQEYVNGEDEIGGRATASKKAKPPPEPRERKNTAVYVTNLPLDVSVQEVSDVFSRCGVIAEEIDRGKPRIKLYTDDDGNFKGDALILYFRAESVDLAIQMLDDTDFRLGQAALGGKIKVAAADFSYKAQKDAPAKSSNNKDKKKIIKKTQKLNKSSYPAPLFEYAKQKSPNSLSPPPQQEDPAAILEIKEDIRDECSKIAAVTNVVLFDKEAAGVASVRFSNAEGAKACVMHNRFFAGTRVEAYISDGSERFKKSAEKRVDDDAEGEGEDEEGRRLDQFGRWLEEGGGGEEGIGVGL
ncbi:MAG: hypothetical protein L6R40_001219 [Gallowayella cf. fulva]|nr:MAG: hypothetical protein L6R40_001219 [Xanthomendoza cf. fulva]